MRLEKIKDLPPGAYFKLLMPSSLLYRFFPWHLQYRWGGKWHDASLSMVGLNESMMVEWLVNVPIHFDDNPPNPHIASIIYVNEVGHLHRIDGPAWIGKRHSSFYLNDICYENELSYWIAVEKSLATS